MKSLIPDLGHVFMAPFTRRSRRTSQCRSIVTLSTGLLSLPAFGLTTLSYTSEKNDRFSSGYPTSPVENTSSNFVGAGLDWAGVGWASTAATKSFGFLSPSHYLVARHFGGAANVRIFADGTVQTYAQSKIEDIGLGVVFQNETLGDLSLGTLNNPIPGGSGLPRYAVLDLNSASGTNTTSAYNNLPLLLYGRGPNATTSTRVGAATINSVTISGNNHYFTTTRDTTQLESGDSGSPAVHRWLNPAGGEEITLVGNHAAINDTSNFINFTGTFEVMNSLNSLMNDDGFALRVVGNPSNTWVGSSNTSIANAGSWGLGGPGPPQSAPSDRFVNFNGSTAGNNRAVTIDTNHNLRGLYFRPTSSESLGFTFGGGSTLTVGRGGITNYDTSRQTFNAALALGASQMWNGGAGGITTAGIQTNGHLLEITTTGLSRITGAIIGSGSLALSGGTLELTAASTYSGTTWVHDGTLLVNNTTGSATGSGQVMVAAGATLAGDGTIVGNAVISGMLSPGNSIGSLAIQGNTTWNGNASAPWQFELGAAASTQAAAALGISEQDMLLITGDFIKGSGTVWTFDFLNTGEQGWYQLVTWDGGSTNFISENFTVTNLAGGWSGQFHVDNTSSSLYLQVIPEPHTAVLIMFGAIGVAFRRLRI
jgi:autotransporter-associated beta strand protein